MVRVTAVLRDVVIDRGGARHQAQQRRQRDDDARRVLDARPHRRRRWILLSIEQDAEGAHHLDAPIVASPWSDDARLHDEAVTELAVADATPDARIGELVDVDYAGDGARPGARPLGRRRALRPRGAGGGRAARGRGVGGGGRRRRRRARARRHAARRRTRCSTRAARAPGSSSAARACRRSRIVALDAGAADVHRRGRAQRPPLPRGPRHRRGARGLEGPRDHVHRALDARARRRPGDAVADRRDRAGGLAPCSSPSPTSRRAATARRSTPSAPRSSAAARACSTSTATRPPPQPSSRSRGAGRAARGAARGRARGGRADRPDRARGRAPARRRGRRRADRPPHRRRARRRRAPRRCCSAHRLGRDLGLPVYLYGALAGGRARASLRAARRARAASRPTTGRRGLHPTAGATLVAARPPLVAFNVELAPPATLEDARRIAALIREGGAEGLPGVRALGLQLAATSSRSRPTSRTTRA